MHITSKSLPTRADYPAELTDRPQWLVWRYINKTPGKKPSKMPYYASGSMRGWPDGRPDDGKETDTQWRHQQGSPNDRAALVDFDTALAAARAGGYNGLGFAFLPGDGLIGIDLDKVVGYDDERDDLGRSLVTDCNTFAELSPSRTGLHIIGRGELRTFKSNDIGVEVFCGSQFFTMPGERHPDSPFEINDIPPDVLARLLALVDAAKEARKEATPPAPPAPPMRPAASGGSRYAEAAFASAVQAVRTQGEGGRNDALNREAFGLGRLVGAGLLAEHEVHAALHDAGLACGLGASEVASSLRSGLEAGKRSPRVLEQRAAPAAVAPTARAAADAPEWVDSETGEIYVPPAAPAHAGAIAPPPAAAWIDARDGTASTRALTEHGNALRLSDAWGDRLRYISARKAWLLWDDAKWCATDAGPVRAMAARLPEAIYREGLAHQADGVHFAKWARKSQEARVMNAVVQMLSDMPGQRLELAELDADPMLCGFDAGRRVLDLRNGAVRPAAQSDHITKSLNASTIGHAGQAVRWLGFMRDVTCGDEELLDWLHRFLGYCLTGSNSEEVFVFLFGHGANGKSVLTETMQTLLGGYAAGIQAATLCDDKRNAAGPSPDLARLDGVRFAVAPEAEEGSKFAESMLKALVSGDTLPVRELNCAPFDMRPCLKLVLTGNHKPTISGTDRGVWRRVRLVPFAASFEGRADMRLKSRLLEEAPHILAWLVAGCIEWQKRGLVDTPRAIAAATEAYRVESDTLGQWLEERCMKGPEAREASADLYADFRQWCASNGFSKIITSLSFLKRLGEYRASGWAIEAEKVGGKRFRTGIALRERTPVWGSPLR